MKKIVIGFPLLFSGITLSVGLTGCGQKGDKDVERAFHGSWQCEYYMNNDNVRMKVTEKVHFDTLSHTYKVDQLQELIYPVKIKYADVSYKGTWSADNRFLTGKIDQSSVVNKLNNQFEEHPEYKVYLDFVEDAAEADMKGDVFLIRRIEPDRIHLYDDDRDVAHDWVRLNDRFD